jgi:acetyltransferase-like isoleucine patch superfamily enzyme
MHKIIIKILQYKAKLDLSRYPHIRIHPTAKVNFRGVRYHHGSSLEIGYGSIVEGSLVSERDGANIIIGSNTFIGGSLLASASRIEVGDDVLISWGCNIVDHNSHAIEWTRRKQDVKDWYYGKKDWTPVAVKPVRICNKAWLGINVIVLKGVEIGEGAVVAAGSVVTKSVPPWTVSAGNPAKVIREISIEDR